jgi:hypothetical protein
MPLILLSRLALCILLLAGLNSNAKERVAQIGDIENVDDISVQNSPNQEATFGKSYTSPGGGLSRFGFRLVKPGKYSGTIIISTEKWVDSINLSSLSVTSTSWSLIGNDALTRIEVKGAKSPGKAPVRIMIYRSLKGVGGRLESVVVPPSKFEEAYEFETDPVLRDVANGVAILVFPADTTTYGSCTGFLVGGSRLVTNAHCVGSQSDCLSTVVIFGYKTKAPGVDEVGAQYRCSKLLSSPAAAQLDLAVLSLTPKPSASLRVLALAPADQTSGAVAMLQYPGGDSIKASRLHCAITTYMAMTLDTHVMRNREAPARLCSTRRGESWEFTIGERTIRCRTHCRSIGEFAYSDFETHWRH